MPFELLLPFPAVAACWLFFSLILQNHSSLWLGLGSTRQSDDYFFTNREAIITCDWRNVVFIARRYNEPKKSNRLKNSSSRAYQFRYSRFRYVFGHFSLCALGHCLNEAPRKRGRERGRRNNDFLSFYFILCSYLSFFCVVGIILRGECDLSQ